MPTAFRRGKGQRAKDPTIGLAPVGVQLAQPQTPISGPRGNAIDEFLYGPTDRPNEPITAGATARKAPPPESVAGWLPKLVAASRQPDAPPELIAFLRRLRIAMGID